MAIAIGRKADHVRVLSDLSGLVVRALLDGGADEVEDNAFSVALRRYREEGAPDIGASWRAAAPAGPAAGTAATEVLRHLTRDLLERVSMLDAPPDAAPTAVTDTPPPNVRPITDAREVPALEMADDGTWRPSGTAVSRSEDLDAGARRRANVPSLMSRYPELARPQGVVLPPAPTVARFTQVTAPPPQAAPRAPGLPSEQPAVPTPAPEDLPPAAEAERAPTATAPSTPILVDRESVIRAVAGGTEVVAGPFARFQQLATFVKRLRAQPGVQDVTTRQFVRGTVHLRVRHSHTVPLADRLRDLTEFSPSIVSSTHDRIEITVEPPDDVPPARG